MDNTQLLDTLQAFLRIPSISTLPEHQPDIRRCAEFVADLLRQAGLDNVRLIEGEGNPLVYGDWLHAPGKPTLLFYGQMTPTLQARINAAISAVAIPAATGSNQAAIDAARLNRAKTAVFFSIISPEFLVQR